MKYIRRTIWPLLLLALFPAVSHAEAGELGGIAELALKIFLVVGIGLALLWIGLSLLLFLRVLRKKSWGKRLGWSVLFLFSPVLLALMFLGFFVLGDSPSQVTEITRKPLTVYGVTFPPGSTASYEQTGGLFGWQMQRTLQEIHGPGPVLLGKLRIDGFIFIPNNSGNEVRLELSAGSTIDGWPCSDTTVSLEPKGPVLQSCFLAAPHKWQGQMMQAGAFVMPKGAAE